MTETIDETASRWLARLDREDASDQDRAAFEIWRGADPRHAAAYARLEDVWNRLLRIRELRADPMGGGDTRPANSAVRSTRAWLTRFRARAVAAACLVAVTISLLVWAGYETPDRSQHFATEVGGYRRAPLRDGSTVELNTDTELRASITATTRHVELLRGEATFEVARDPHRPFVVTAGDTAVRAVGTVFNVRRHEHVVEILMIEGKVAVGAPEDALRSEPPRTSTIPVIHAGQAAIAAQSGLEVRAVSSEELERELAWQKGMLSFDSITLAEATAEFNRYNRSQLIVSDPSIADVRIGGYFRASNVDGFVRVLESEFAISATHERGRIKLTRTPVPDTRSPARPD